MAEFDVSKYQIGARCVCEGYCATIRYIGEVPPTKGVWLGVEWDDVSRGKHNGEHEGVRYFTCKKGKGGSFVRPKKASLGCTFVDAVKERYGGSTYSEETIYVDSKLVEVVGVDKITKQQSEYDKLQDISLRGMCISAPGQQRGSIQSLVPNLQVVDLSLNHLLCSWQVLADIAVELKMLSSLQISENLYLGLPSNPVSLAPSFNSLRSLFINKMRLTWTDVVEILRVTPNLEILHACKNKIVDLRYNDEDLGNHLPVNLHLLNLEDNQISEWSEIMRLSCLPQLKTLIVNDNPIKTISVQEENQRHSDTALAQQRQVAFQTMESLSMNGTSINDWSSFEALRSMTSLTEMKFKGNPLLENEPSFSARQLLIARMERLTTLNGCPITERERMLAERHYLKLHALQWVQECSDENHRKVFLTLHPRFAELVQAHGLPEEELTGKREKPSTALKHGLLLINIKCPDDPDRKEMVKKLPVTMTIQKIKGLLQRAYKVDSSDQKLSYRVKSGDQEIELSDDLKPLSFYSVETGDTILLRW